MSDSKRSKRAMGAMDKVMSKGAGEEQQIFPTAQETIGDDKAKQLDAPFLKAKAQAMAAA